MWILLLIALVLVFLVFWWNQKQLQRPRRHWDELFRARRATTHSSSLERVRQLRHHALWADEMLLEAVENAGGAVPEALRELAHVAGAQEVWLARIQGRQPSTAVWPAAAVDDLRPLFEDIHREYAAFVAGLDEADLQRFVTYTNSAGRSFTSSVADILDHVFLHSQYHRGKTNLLLRQAGHTPAPCDFIAFVRGAPAATTNH